jgi:hypothetical protein
MNTLLLRSVPSLLTVAGVAAATTVLLGPVDHEVWVVAWAQGRHDDNGAARVIGFQLLQGITTVNIGPGVSVANGVCIPLYQTNPDGVAGKSGADWQLPLVLNAKTALILSGVAIGAGKKLYIDALVYRFKGMGAWTEIT